MQSKVMKWGNSLAFRIPRSIAAEAGLEYGAAVDVTVDDGAMVVRPTQNYVVKLDALLRKVTKAKLHGEVPAGRRRGREAW